MVIPADMYTADSGHVGHGMNVNFSFRTVNRRVQTGIFFVFLFIINQVWVISYLLFYSFLVIKVLIFYFKIKSDNAEIIEIFQHLFGFFF